MSESHAVRKLSLLIKVVVVLIIVAAALVLFVPVISRALLTTYADQLAEKLLETEVTLSSAELQLLNGSLVVNDLKVYHPKKKDETFIEAGAIAARLVFVPMLWGNPARLSLRIDDPKMVYETNRRGEWELREQIPLFRRGKGERRLPLNVESIIINDGEVEYRDGKVGKTTQVTDIDADITDVMLPTEDDVLPSDFEVDFIIDKAAKFKMTGQADFLSPKVSFKSKIRMKGLPLPPFAPYYDRKDMPVRVKRGTLAMTSDATCKNDQLNAPAHMTITKLEVEPKSKLIMGFASDAVVEHIKDKKGNLELDVLITGNIRHPQFQVMGSISRAFSRELGKSLVKDMPSKLKDIGEGVKKGTKSGVEKLKGLFGK